MTTASIANPEFWNRLAPSYAKKPVPDEAAYRATLERVRNYLTPTSRVLEVGCGTGATAVLLAPYVGNLLGTDVSPKMIEIARARAREAALSHVDFRTGTLEDPSLLQGSYDVVAAFNLFHLLEDIPAAILRATQLLAPGGLLISKTPCLGEQSPLLRVVIPAMRFFGKAPFVNFVTGPLLLQAMRDAGLTIVEQGLYPAKSQSLLIVARKS